MALAVAVAVAGCVRGFGCGRGRVALAMAAAACHILPRHNYAFRCGRLSKISPCRAQPGSYLNFAGSSRQRREVNFAGPFPWEVKTDAAIYIYIYIYI